MGHEKGRRKKIGYKVFVGAVAASVVAVILGGLIISGSPKEERARQFDAQRLGELQQISYAIDAYWNYEGKLPESAVELLNRREYYVPAIGDPRTGEAYQYQVLDADSYELCANFETESGFDAKANGSFARPVPAHPAGEQAEGFWKHGIGRTCYTIDVRKDPSRFPPKF